MASPRMEQQRAIRAGLIGCGAIALKGLIPGWMPKRHPHRPIPPPFLEFGGSDGLTITVVCDVNPAALLEVQRILPAAWRLDDWHRILTLRADLDAIIIATPNHLHE